MQLADVRVKLADLLQLLIHLHLGLRLLGVLSGLFRRQLCLPRFAHLRQILHKLIELFVAHPALSEQVRLLLFLEALPVLFVLRLRGDGLLGVRVRHAAACKRLVNEPLRLCSGVLSGLCNRRIPLCFRLPACRCKLCVAGIRILRTFAARFCIAFRLLAACVFFRRLVVCAGCLLCIVLVFFGRVGGLLHFFALRLFFLRLCRVGGFLLFSAFVDAKQCAVVDLVHVSLRCPQSAGLAFLRYCCEVVGAGGERYHLPLFPLPELPVRRSLPVFTWPLPFFTFCEKGALTFCAPVFWMLPA